MSESPIFDALFCEFAVAGREVSRELVLLFVYGQPFAPWEKP